LQLRRVLICLDADDQVHIPEPGTPVSCSCSYPSDAHTISSHLLYSKVLAMEKATMVRVIRIVGECHIVTSALLISYFLTEFIGELKDEFQRSFVVKYSDKANSPLKNVEKKLDNKVRTQQHLKLTQSGS